MCCNIEEKMGEMWSSIFRPVRCWKRQNQQHGLPRWPLFTMSKKSQRIVRYQIRIIILKRKSNQESIKKIQYESTAYLMIVEAMLDLLAVHVDAVVVVFAVHDEATPLAPSWWYVRPVVLVQVLAEVSCEQRSFYNMSEIVSNRSYGSHWMAVRRWNRSRLLFRGEV